MPSKEALENVASKEGQIVEGTIKKITSYGMFVDVGGVDGLVHYKEISYKGPINPAFGPLLFTMIRICAHQNQRLLYWRKK